jgi:hypothetical protein
MNVTTHPNLVRVYKWVELYLHPAVHLYGVYRDRFIFTFGALKSSGTVHK